MVAPFQNYHLTPSQQRKIVDDQYYPQPLSWPAAGGESGVDNRGRVEDLPVMPTNLTAKILTATKDSNGYYVATIFDTFAGPDDTSTQPLIPIRVQTTDTLTTGQVLQVLIIGITQSGVVADDQLPLTVPISAATGSSTKFTKNESGSMTEIDGPITSPDVQIFEKTGITLVESNDTAGLQGLALAVLFDRDSSGTESTEGPPMEIDGPVLIQRNIYVFDHTGISLGESDGGKQGFMLVTKFHNFEGSTGTDEPVLIDGPINIQRDLYCFKPLALAEFDDGTGDVKQGFTVIPGLKWEWTPTKTSNYAAVVGQAIPVSAGALATVQVTFPTTAPENAEIMVVVLGTSVGTVRAFTASQSFNGVPSTSELMSVGAMGTGYGHGAWVFTFHAAIGWAVSRNFAGLV